MMKYILTVLLTIYFVNSYSQGFPPAGNPLTGGSTQQILMKNSNASYDWSWSTYFGTSSVTTVGTIGTGTWQGTLIAPQYGGTGVNNSTRTLTINTNSGTVDFTGASKTLTVPLDASVSGTNTGDNATNTQYSGLAASKQDVNAKLTSISALANASGFLKNDGSGNFSYDNPAGSGTVTNTGTLTANSLVLGNGSADTKVSTGFTTDGTSILTLGVAGASVGTVAFKNATSGTASLTAPTGALGTYAVTLPPVAGQILLNTTTSGVAASPTASGTVTITHNLGRVPTIMRIQSISSFTSNAAATPVPFSYGTWNSTGNRCLYMVINGTTTQVSQTSTTFAIIMVTSAGNQITGVVQNATSTTIDIAFTETGTHTAGNYLWEVQ